MFLHQSVIGYQIIKNILTYMQSLNHLINYILLMVELSIRGECD